jgi:hypothetical protein
MNSLSFPNLFYKNSTSTVEGVEATKQNLKLMLQIEKHEQLGDPDFGVKLNQVKFSTNPSLASELAVDGVIEAQKFVNNVLFYRDNVEVKKTEAAKVDITIEALFSSASNVKDLVIIQGVDID